MIKPFCFFGLLLMVLDVRAQKLQHDWENYVVSLRDKPVSVNVDLGLRSAVPINDMPLAIIVRLKLKDPNSAGMPNVEEANLLDLIEDKLLETLAKYNGALYVGRFTQRSIREFYFYTNDTSNYMSSIASVFRDYPTYQWLARSNKDSEWENYLSVLYPSELDKLLIDSRRKLEEKLKNENKQDQVTLFHYFEFKDEATCKKFLQSSWCVGLTVNEMAFDASSKHISLLLSGKIKLDRNWIEKNIPVVFSEAKKQGGLYKGWEYQQ